MSYEFAKGANISHIFPSNTRSLTPRVEARLLWETAINNARAVVGVITIVGAVLRLVGLGGKPLWYDEATLWLTARPGDLHTVFEANADTNSAPPLFVLLVHYVLSANSSEVALRMIPAFAAIATIPVVYFLSMSLWPNRVAGYLSALLVALAPEQVAYGQQVREYSLTVLLTGLLLLVGWRVSSNPSPPLIGLLTLLEGLAVVTQYGLLVVLATVIPLVTIALWRAREMKALRLLVILQSVPAAVGLIVVFSTLRHQMQTGGFESAGYLSAGYWQSHSLRSLADLAIGHTYHIVGFSLAAGSVPTGAAVLLGAAGILMVLRLSRGWRVLLLLLGPFVVTFALSIVHLYPYLAARQDIYLMIPVTLLVSWGAAAAISWSPHIGRVPGEIARVVIPTAMLAALLLPLGRETVSYLRSAGDENITVAMATLQAQRSPGDGVYVYNGAIPAYLYNRCRSGSCPHMFLADADARVLLRTLPASVVGHVVLGDAVGEGAKRYRATQVMAVLHRWPRVWLLFSHTNIGARDRILAIARRQGQVIARATASAVSLYLFMRG